MCLSTGPKGNSIGIEGGMEQCYEVIKHCMQALVLSCHDIIDFPVDDNGVWQAGVAKFERWPTAIGIIDGTSTPVSRAIGRYSGHRHDWVFHTQVFLKADQQVGFVGSGYLGRKSDPQQVRESPLADLLAKTAEAKLEVLGDTAYQKVKGVKTPPAVRKTAEATALFTKYRARIEHFFGHLKTEFKVLDQRWPFRKSPDLLAQAWVAAAIIWTMRVRDGHIKPYPMKQC